MRSFKISTIIPVYNTEKYLEICLNSIVNQTIGLENIQVIIVNDGSTDNSENIIKNYLNKYSNIEYYKKENGGQSSARNLGLTKAKGEYISFVDSDDWLELEMYEVLYEMANTKKMDIVTCDFCTVKQTQKKYISTRFIKNYKKNFIMVNTGPCNMIIKRSFLSKIKFQFPIGIIYEDLAVIPSLALYNIKIKLIEKAYYNYLIRENSSMNQTEYNDKLKDIFISIKILKKNFNLLDKNKVYNEELEFLFIRYLLMGASLRFIRFNDPKNCLQKISSLMQTNFPNWKNNKYFRKLSFRQRIIAFLVCKNRKKTLRLLFKVNEAIKK